ncbi:MAG: glycosyltransferase family 4 protein [Anaerolineae bacterium]|nr:glycosyltransferase family 4 protein [Anaerolineae bacterium]
MGGTSRRNFHIAINAHLLSSQAGYRSAGVHQYIYQLLCHLEQTDDLRYTVLVGEGEIPPNASLSSLRSRWPTGRVPVRVLWEHLVQPWTLHQIDADLVHGPVFIAPLISTCPTVITIHDLSFIRLPHLFRPANRLYLTVMTRLSAQRARRLIAVSAHTAAESAELLGVPMERIDVIYHGVDPIFRPLPDDEIEAFRQRQGLPDQFVLCVGTLEPRKNHTRLVEAFARIYDGKSKLVLVGGKGWLYDELFAKVEALGLNEAIAFKGYVANEDLPLWYNAATVFAYPSLYEGFGMPILEAQACGTAVMTSTAPPLPETAGDAALLVNPRDAGDLAANLKRLLTDEPLRSELEERGLARARQFTWMRTAQETACVYRRALEKGD